MSVGLSEELFARYQQPQELLEEWRRVGYHTDALVGPLIFARLAQTPGRVAVIDGERRITCGELVVQAGSLAAAFRAAGVGRGDVVSWQVPNWWEALVVALATWRVGAVNNPVLMIYREHELRQIFADLRPAVVVAPARFRRQEHQEMLDSVLAELGHEPRLRVGVRGGDRRWTPLEDQLVGRAAPFAEGVAPGDPCVVAYTSGTTAGAKGVVVDHRGLVAETRQMRDVWGLAWQDRTFMPAPLAHLTGLTVGLTVPFSAGASVALMDIWDPEQAVPLIEREQCVLSSGTPTFLEEIVSQYEGRGERTTALRQYSVGGAAVPPSLIERAEAVGVGAFRCYGMTEHLSATIPNRGMPIEVRRDTDGPIAPGTEISCVDEEGRVLAPGVPGEIRVRGPERMLAYIGPEDNVGVLDPVEGWFSTGDIGAVDGDGCLRILGRIKDIINRGGEKFSAREMEDIICRHPAVRQAAVVPVPSDRYGEVPVAFVVLTDGAELPAAAALAEFVQGQGLAKQKTPTGWTRIDALPTTPFGKVKKHELVERHVGSGATA
ncbi:MAG TPA: AMP-binding protein [Conexibacter sp.]|nr:AMP-binding protein [Conexibacter sp.]